MLYLTIKQQVCDFLTCMCSGPFSQTQSIARSTKLSALCTILKEYVKIHQMALYLSKERCFHLSVVLIHLVYQYLILRLISGANLFPPCALLRLNFYKSFCPFCSFPWYSFFYVQIRIFISWYWQLTPFASHAYTQRVRLWYYA